MKQTEADKIIMSADENVQEWQYRCRDLFVDYINSLVVEPIDLNMLSEGKLRPQPTKNSPVVEDAVMVDSQPSRGKPNRVIKLGRVVKETDTEIAKRVWLEWVSYHAYKRIDDEQPLDFPEWLDKEGE